jgi:hypothetical protein
MERWHRVHGNPSSSFKAEVAQLLHIGAGGGAVLCHARGSAPQVCRRPASTVNGDTEIAQLEREQTRSTRNDIQGACCMWSYTEWASPLCLLTSPIHGCISMFGHTMQLKDRIQKQLCELSSGHAFTARSQVNHFGQLVDEHSN